MIRALVASLAAAAVLVPAAAAQSDPYAALLAPAGTCAQADAPALAPAAARQTMLCLANYARARRGLAPLRLDDALDAAGAAKLAGDVSCREFSHTPCGRPFASVFSGYLAGAAGYRIGENIAWGTGGYGSPRSTMNTWLHSPGHRANLLSPAFRDLGVGYLPSQSFQGYAGVALWSTEFGTKQRRY